MFYHKIYSYDPVGFEVGFKEWKNENRCNYNIDGINWMSKETPINTNNLKTEDFAI